LSGVQAFLCNWIEAAFTAAGADLGGKLGGEVGGALALPTGEVIAPATVIAGQVAGTALGGAAGHLAGQAVTNVLFSRANRDGTGGDEHARQRKRLSNGEIKKMQDAGIDPHDLKENNSNLDLFKEPNGDIYIHPKDGSGPGDPTGLNIYNLPKPPQ